MDDVVKKEDDLGDSLGFHFDYYGSKGRSDRALCEQNQHGLVHANESSPPQDRMLSERLEKQYNDAQYESVTQFPNCQNLSSADDIGTSEDFLEDLDHVVLKERQRMLLSREPVGSIGPSMKVSFYEASLTIRGKIGIVTDILRRLSDSKDRLALFRATCFGPWLDLRSGHGDPLLVHVILQTQTVVPDAGNDEIWFHVAGHHLRFGPEEFCLITGLRFGSMDALPVPTSNGFRARVFPHHTAMKNVKGTDLMKVFQGPEFEHLSNEDAVRVCLLLLLELGFLGRQPNLVVTEHLLSLVEDFAAWNSYPWGSFVWAATLPQLKGALLRREDHAYVTHKPPQYSLTGFIYAFKVWIFETFPVSKHYAESNGTIPRAISWSRKSVFYWKDCLRFIRADNRPQTSLTPTAAERAAEWWTTSRHFFDRIAEEVDPPPRSPGIPSPPVRSPQHVADEVDPPLRSPCTPSSLVRSPQHVADESMRSPRVLSPCVRSPVEPSIAVPTPVLERLAALERRVPELEETIRMLIESNRQTCHRLDQLEAIHRAEVGSADSSANDVDAVVVEGCHHVEVCSAEQTPPLLDGRDRRAKNAGASVRSLWMPLPSTTSSRKRQKK